MGRFEAIRHLDGGEIFDNVLQRTVDMLPSYSGAAREADRLNRIIQASSQRAITKVLANSALYS